MIFFSFSLLIGRDWGFKKGRGRERGRGLFVCFFRGVAGEFGTAWFIAFGCGGAGRAGG